MTPRTRNLIIAVTLIGFVLAALIATDAIPFLRGGFGWQWPYAPAPLVRALPLFGVTVVYLGVAWLLLTRTNRTWPVIVWSMIGVISVTLAVMALRETNLLETLFDRTVSSITVGTHYAAATIDWTSDGRYNWPAVMKHFDQLSGHVSVSPPGLPMFYALLNNLFAVLPSGLLASMRSAVQQYQCANYTLLGYTPAEWATSWFGILAPLWASLAVLPFYAVAKRVTSAEWARRAVVWWALVPALVTFSPTWSTIYPGFSLLAFWLFDIGLTRKRGAAWLVAAGLLMGVMSFTNFVFLPFVAFFGFYTLARYFLVERKTEPWTRPILVGVWFAIGLVIPWVIYYLLTRLTPLDIFAAAMSIHFDIPRPYLPWLFLHPWDWTLWTGLPMMLLWILGLWAWSRVRETERPPLLGIALLLFAVTLDLSGTARGESGRVWLPFTPFALIAAVDGLRRLNTLTPDPSPSGRGEQANKMNQPVSSLASDLTILRPQTSPSGASFTPLSPGEKPGVRAAFSLITAAQAVIMLVLTISLAVINAPDLKPQPTPPGGLQTAQTSGAAFDSAFKLAGWDATADSSAVTLRLDWQATAPMTTPYWFSALLVGPDGAPLPQATVWQPLQTNYPTTCWATGEQIGETITLPLPADAKPGDWYISLAALTDDHASARLPVTLADGSTDTQVGLGPVKVP